MQKLLLFFLCTIHTLPLLAAAKKTSKDFPASAAFFQQMEDVQHQLHVLSSQNEILQAQLESQAAALRDLSSQKFAASERQAHLDGDRRLQQVEKTQAAQALDLGKIKDWIDALQQKSLPEIYQAQKEMDHKICCLKQALEGVINALQGESGASCTTYLVQPGDSLEKIARKHGLKIADIKALNHLQQDRIQIGQHLKLPSHAE